MLPTSVYWKLHSVIQFSYISNPRQYYICPSILFSTDAGFGIFPQHPPNSLTNYDQIKMATIQYMSRGFVHIVESPPESRWLRLRGPPIENVNLTRGPTTQAEIWQMRFNRHFRSLLVEIWLNEYREGWSVGFLFSHCLFSMFCILSTNTILVIVRRLFRIESPFFEVGDVLNNGTEVPHFRSVVVFARFAPNEAWGTKTRRRLFGRKKNMIMELQRSHLSILLVAFETEVSLMLDSKVSECWHCAQAGRRCWAEIKILRRMVFETAA